MKQFTILYRISDGPVRRSFFDALNLCDAWLAGLEATREVFGDRAVFLGVV